MKCPHCMVEFHDKPEWQPLGKDKDGYWAVLQMECPACERMVLYLCCGRAVSSPHTGFSTLTDVRVRMLVRPKGSNRPPCPPEVKTASPDIASDYEESCLVLADSPKASAALSRRCLQHVLREKAKTTKKDLADQIQEVLNSGKLPSHIEESLEAVRVIGNFAAHPTKSKSTGEIVDVEPGEAEWNLEAVEALFDFYYVQPAKTAARKAALNQKLVDAGKPQIK
jgi:uncharacterized protein DUF4145